MRIGIDAHILSPEHHRHHPEIAEYTKYLIASILDQDKKNSYVLFMDSRMPKETLEEFRRENTEIKNFPFAQYRSYLPFIYSHMLVSSILTTSRLDVFHSPEGLIPYLYPGNVIATFHWVPMGVRDSNIFTNTWMYGARMGFSTLCRKADHILLKNGKDRDILCGLHKYPEERAHVLPFNDCKAVNWKDHASEVINLYETFNKTNKIKVPIKDENKKSFLKKFSFSKKKDKKTK